VIGASVAPPAVLAQAELLGRLIVEAGWRVVCGGRAGVMEATCRGARGAAGYREGDTVGILPHLEHSGANDFVDVVIPTPLGLARNAVVVAAGDAVVAVAGGSGTLSEIALAWQFDRPVVALDLGVGWSAELAGRALDGRREDVIHRATSPEEAVAILEGIFGGG
jgi:uncharacterized protein (TIGR00725 family)